MPSAAISAMHYDKPSQALEIVFITGAVYRYLQVPENVYDNMKNAISKGRYLNKFIKGRFEYEKIQQK